MEAIGPMRWQSLPPAGNTIRLESSAESLGQLLPGYQLVWLNSGTAALAFSLVQLKMRYPAVSQPEVIIPGYCCPDLVAAALFAGFIPRVVDICVDDPSYDLAQLECALTQRTLAVIAINFLGITERLTEIRQLLAPWPKVGLIEDNAQWFPDAYEVAGLQGDYVTFSFGRGKAVSLLGGGLVAVKEGLALFDLKLSTEAGSPSWRLKVRLLALLSQPWAYSWMEQLPFLKLGATRYHALDNICLMSAAKLLRVRANVTHYRSLSRFAEQGLKARIASTHNGLHALLTSPRGRRLLRFPLLSHRSADRARLTENSALRGLGVSRLYNGALSELEGISELALQMGPLPNAVSFARRLLTLPTHQQVKACHLAAITTLVATDK